MNRLLLAVCVGLLLPAAAFATALIPAATGSPVAADSQAPEPSRPAPSNPSEDFGGHLLDVKPIRRMKGLADNGGRPIFLAFSPGGETLTLAAYHVLVWDVETGKELHHWHEKGWATEGLSHDGATVAILKGRDVHLIQTANGRGCCQLQGNHNFYGATNVFAFSLDGRIIAADSFDKPGYRIRFWEAATGKELPALTGLAQGSVRSLAMSPDGKVFALGLEGIYVELYDMTSQRFLRRFGDQRPLNSEMPQHTETPTRMTAIVAVTFSPDGKVLAVGDNDGTIDLWEVATGHRLSRLGGGPRSLKDFTVPTVGSLLFSADGRRLASVDIFPAGMGRDPIHLWDVATGRAIIDLGQSGQFKAIALSPDGHLLASASDDGTVSIWDISSMRVTRAALPSVVSAPRQVADTVK